MMVFDIRIIIAIWIILYLAITEINPSKYYMKFKIELQPYLFDVLFFFFSLIGWFLKTTLL